MTLPVAVRLPVTLVVVPAGAVSTPPMYDIPDTASCDALTLPLMVAVASVVAPLAFSVPAMSWFVGSRALFRVPESIFVAVRFVMFLPFPKKPTPAPLPDVTLAVVVMFPAAVVLPVWSPTSEVAVRLVIPVIVVGSRALGSVPASTLVALRDVRFRPLPKKPRPTADDAVTLAVVVIFAAAVSVPPMYVLPDTATCDALTLPVMVAVASVVAPLALSVPLTSTFVGRRALFRVPESTLVALNDVTLRPFPKNPKPPADDAVTLAVVVMFPVDVRFPLTSPTRATAVKLAIPVIVVGSRAVFRVPESTLVALKLVRFRPFPKNPKPPADDAVTLAVVVMFPVDVRLPVTSVVVPAGAVSAPPTYASPDAASCDAFTLPLAVTVAVVTDELALTVETSIAEGRRGFASVPVVIALAFRLVRLPPLALVLPLTIRSPGT